MTNPSTPFGGPSSFEMKMESFMQQQIAATLAAALIVVSGRPHSPAEAKEVFGNMQFTLNPSPNHGRYQTWEKEGHGTKVHT